MKKILITVLVATILIATAKAVPVKAADGGSASVRVTMYVPEPAITMKYVTKVPAKIDTSKVIAITSGNSIKTENTEYEKKVVTAVYDY